MYDQFNPRKSSVPRAINLLLLLALIGVILTGGQASLIIFRGDTVCLNEGCKVVESLTTVSPLVFNLAGCLFFFTVLVGCWLVRLGSSMTLGLVRLLLLAAMAAEGGLLSFQHDVAQVFCSYCLIIFTIIFLLNLLLGLRHLFKGMVMLVAVVVAFSALKFSHPKEQEAGDIDTGVYGVLQREAHDLDLYLFFSATCPHCEEVMATIDEDFTCSIHFNPVGTVNSLPVEGSLINAEYTPAVNRKVLKAAGFNEIPVLMVKGEGEVNFFAGKSRILDYLADTCRPVVQPAPEVSADTEIIWQQPVQTGFGERPAVQPYMLPGTDEESCGIDVDCEEENGAVPPESAN